MSETKSCSNPSSCACAPGSSSSTSSTSSAIQNGKGDSPRNISTRFRKNYDGIKWSSGGKSRKEGNKFVKTY